MRFLLSYDFLSAQKDFVCMTFDAHKKINTSFRFRYQRTRFRVFEFWSVPDFGFGCLVPIIGPLRGLGGSLERPERARGRQRRPSNYQNCKTQSI
jgi:hypothetical protein